VTQVHLKPPVKKKRVPLWNLNVRRPKFPQPATVIDVGVGEEGTNLLYSSYPDAYHLLVEPLTELEETCRYWTRAYRGEYLIAAAGPRNGTHRFFVNKNCLSNSTLSPRDTAKFTTNREEREVKMVAIGDYVLQRGLKGPFILKVDAEGHDLGVLEGAGKILDETLFVISECWFHTRYSSTPSATPTIHFLLNRGFTLTDILEIAFNKNGSCRWADMVFANDRCFGPRP
jgi:FkbM family methyltransferase